MAKANKKSQSENQVVETEVETVESIDMSKVQAEPETDGGADAPEASEGEVATTSTSNERPPIGKVIIPDLKTTSARIRWLAAQGYSKSEIATRLQKRYQHVFNVLNKPLKVGAREEVPTVAAGDVQRDMSHFQIEKEMGLTTAGEEKPEVEPQPE